MGVQGYHRTVACIFVFIDGVGVGSRDPGKNPLARRSSVLSLFDDGSVPVLPRGAFAGTADATLGVPGRPQSATGQASIFTGENAAAFLGRHLLGFPNAALRDFIRDKSVFKRAAARGARVTFANAFPGSLLRLLGLSHKESRRVDPPLPPIARHVRPSASTCAIAAAGVGFRTLDDAWDGVAVTHDFTGEAGRRRGFAVPERSPEACAKIVADLAADNDAVLFEHFGLDKAGHDSDMDGALRVLDDLDRFLRALLDRLPPGVTLMASSDHGNVEDLSTGSHTLNRVPVLAQGPGAEAVCANVCDIRDLAPAIESHAAPAARSLAPEAAP